jgi:hypothetical protein
MDDAARVRVRERRGELTRDPLGVAVGQRCAVVEPLLERPAR